MSSWHSVKCLNVNGRKELFIKWYTQHILFIVIWHQTYVNGPLCYRQHLQGINMFMHIAQSLLYQHGTLIGISIHGN